MLTCGNLEIWWTKYVFLRLRLNGYTNIDINIYLLIYYTKVTYTYYV